MRRLVVVPMLALLPLAGPALVSAPADAAVQQTAQAARTAPATKAAKVMVVKVRLRAAVRNRPVANERRAGYQRTKFRHWIDANRNCRDTRDEVLAQESKVRVSGCDVRRGRWRSYYDGTITTSSSSFDIDHLVPLAEAWDSGAHRWNAGTRKRFANDLGDRRSLVAVSASANRSKSDRDPADWMPRLGTCRYVEEWMAVKIRWGLKVDRAEKRALTGLAQGCPNRIIAVKKAAVKTAAKPKTKKPTKPKKAWYPPVSRYNCPAHARIKGNQSGIYHVPGGAYYSRTTPEKCFATEAAARRAGYRPSKL